MEILQSKKSVQKGSFFFQFPPFSPCLFMGRVFHLSCVQCGWFSAGWHEVSGDVINENGETVFQVEGKWNETVYATRRLVSAGAEKIPRTSGIFSSFSFSTLIFLTREEAKDDWAQDDSGNAIRPNHIPYETTLNDIPSFNVDVRCPVWYNVEEKYEDEPYNQWNMTTVYFINFIFGIFLSLFTS